MSPVNLHNLHCEYLKNPLGIDTKAPRFGWQIIAEQKINGLKQSSYHILVASSLEKLEQNQGDLWDTGLVSSAESTLNAYDGAPLPPNTTIYWKAKIWINNHTETPWSDVAHFSIGLLSESDWTGSWIKYPESPSLNDSQSIDDNKHLWYTTSFDLTKKSQSAFIYVASAGYHELYINGKKRDDRVLAPTLSRLDKRVHYVTYEIKDHLIVGNNDIAIHYGPGWSRFSYFKESGAHSAIRAKLCITDTSGSNTTIHTDNNWHCTVSHSENIGPCIWGDNGGELVDGRHSQLPPSINDKRLNWVPAVTLNWQVALSAEMIEPSHIIEKLRPQSISKQGDDYLLDFGKNFTGFLKCIFRKQSIGSRVELVLLEALDDTPRTYQQRSVYICNGKDEEEFQHRFNYCSGRFLLLKGLHQAPQLEDISGQVIANNLTRVGRFNCSNEQFNHIYETDIWTFLANTTEGYTADCPHRERIGYGEVQVATSWGIGFPNFKANAFYSKIVKHWADVQEENGWFHHTIPHINEHFGGPMWSSAGITVANTGYDYNKDRKYLTSIYHSGQKWIQFLKNHQTNGLLKNYCTDTGKWAWGKFLGDWAAPGERNERGDSIEAEFFNNCVFAMNLMDMIRMAKELGHTDDEKKYLKDLTTLRRSIHKAFFNEDNITYGGDTQVHLAFALLVKIVPKEHLSAIKERLAKLLCDKGFLDMGSSGLPVLLKYLVDFSVETKLLYPLLNSKACPSYGYFLGQGETTWPEHWSCKEPSRIHTCYTGVAACLMNGLGGIRPDPQNPGFQRCIIAPCIIDELSYVNTQTESLYGIITSNWKHDNLNLSVDIHIPVNSSAEVVLPCQDIEMLRINENKIDDASSVKLVYHRHGEICLNVESGPYHIQLSK